MMKVKDIVNTMEHFAPAHLKEDWDNVGLQLGNPQAEVNRVMLALTPSEEVIQEAIEKQVDLLVTHHPFIFKGVKTLSTDTVIGAVARQCFQHDLALFCAHTNLDVTKGGVNDVLAERLGLLKIEDFVTTQEVYKKKLVVYVPVSHVEAVKEALFKVKAGNQGAYEACSWQTVGIGQFKPLEEANPYLGKKNELEQVEEVRLEVLVDADKLAITIEALLKAHPYEEVAYDVFDTLSQKQRESIGRIGYLKEPMILRSWLKQVKEALGCEVLTYTGDEEKIIQSLALCGGSAASYLKDAAKCGVDAYITGDVKYHDGQLAEELGVSLIDVGHFAGEQPVLTKLQEVLKQAHPALDVLISRQRDYLKKYF